MRPKNTGTLKSIPGSRFLRAVCKCGMFYKRGWSHSAVKKIKKLELKSNDIVVVQTPVGCRSKHMDIFIKEIKEFLKQNDFNNDIIILSNGTSITNISEEDMNKIGWVKYVK